MKTKLLLTGMLAGMLAIFLSCSGEHSGFKKTESGIYYKIHTENPEGETVEMGDILTLEMIYRTEDSTLFDTRMNQQPMNLPMQEKQYEGDIHEALALLKVGDSATFILNADSFFLKTAGMPELPSFITPGSDLYFDVKINSAQSEQELQDERAALMESRKDLEPQELAEYLERQEITVSPAESGLYYIEEERGSGPIVKDGDRIKAHFIISTITGSQLYSSYDVGEPLEIEIGRTFDNDGVTEALRKMRDGTKATVIVPSSLAFGPEGRGEMVPPYTTMIYEIEVVEFTTKEQFEQQQQQSEREMKQMEEQRRMQEKTQIQDYLKENDLEGLQTGSGLYYIEQVKGTGPKPEPGQTVKVHYTGTLLNGQKFDSSVDRGEPFEFTLGAGQVIQGWDEGIALMNVGSKAILVVPFDLGYGSRAMGQQIPAFSTLVFEVELLEVN
jgi:FKBP-type peptidyl-prolyl cis-trans isomerase